MMTNSRYTRIRRYFPYIPLLLLAALIPSAFEYWQCRSIQEWFNSKLSFSDPNNNLFDIKRFSFSHYTSPTFQSASWKSRLCYQSDIYVESLEPAVERVCNDAESVDEILKIFSSQPMTRSEIIEIPYGYGLQYEGSTVYLFTHTRKAGILKILGGSDVLRQVIVGVHVGVDGSIVECSSRTPITKENIIPLQRIPHLIRVMPLNK